MFMTAEWDYFTQFKAIKEGIDDGEAGFPWVLMTILQHIANI